MEYTHTTATADVPVAELAGISDIALDTVQGGFLRSAYRGAVNHITAAGAGWQLANQMYGEGKPDPNASYMTQAKNMIYGGGGQAPLTEKLRARSAFKEFLDGTDKLPSWAPNW